MNTRNIVGGAYSEGNGETFFSVNPSTGAQLEGSYTVASEEQINAVMAASADAFKVYRNIDKSIKSAFLRTIATEMEQSKEAIIAAAMEECALTEPRLQGEMARTTGQLRMFADLIDEGSWVDANIETAIPDRKPLPRADIRRMLIPIGPVVMFGASNFPLAFSVVGGDTAAAFAAGCPVVVKVHPAHPKTSALTGAAVMRAIEQSGVPKAVFSMLYDNGHTVGTKLVTHPKTKAVAFTGSLRGGMALHKLAQSRPEPIPVFAEMGSTNPVFIFPEALQAKKQEIAEKFALSVCNGAGQFCTKPGLIFAMECTDLNAFGDALSEAVRNAQPVTMLTKGIHENYENRAAEVLHTNGVNVLVGTKSQGTIAQPKLASVSAADWLANPTLAEEVFGPFALLISIKDNAQLAQVINALQGQLTTTIVVEGSDVQKYEDAIINLTDKAGRIIYNGVPTGVEVHTAINHGGPFPATNNQFTSVGSNSIYRFVRPIAYQDWPAALLPAELRDGNPTGIFRKINNIFGKD